MSRRCVPGFMHDPQSIAKWLGYSSDLPTLQQTLATEIYDVAIPTLLTPWWWFVGNAELVLTPPLKLLLSCLPRPPCATGKFFRDDLGREACGIPVRLFESGDEVWLDCQPLIHVSAERSSFA